MKTHRRENESRQVTEDEATSLARPQRSTANVHEEPEADNAAATASAERDDQESPKRRRLLRERLRGGKVPLWGLFTLAVLYTLWIGQPVFLPVTFALLVTFALRPIQHGLEKVGINGVVAALLIFLSLLFLIVGTIVLLYGPAVAWAERFPAYAETIEQRMVELRGPVEKLQAMAEKVEEVTQSEEESQAVQVVQVQPEGLGSPTVGYIFSLITYSVLVLVLAFFFLGWGRRVSEKLADKHWIELVERVVSSVSNYLLTITVINMGLGVAIGLAMFFLGMPNPLLWGVMGAVFNFVPYLGAIVGAGIVFVVALATFESMMHIILVPVAYYLLTAVEGTFITPMVLGQRFTVNPIFILVWLLLWGWIWGISGAILAVPMLVATKIVLDETPVLRRFSHLADL